MPSKIICEDITKIKCDAVVKPDNRFFSHGYGKKFTVHKPVGEKNYSACPEDKMLEVGETFMTDAIGLPSKHVIHVAEPFWRGGARGEEALLRSCYFNVLNIALNSGCKSIAIPLLSSGSHGFPKDKVLRIAHDVISSFLLENEMLVYIVIFDRDSYSINERVFDSIFSLLSKIRYPICAYSAQSDVSFLGESDAPVSVPGDEIVERIRNMDKGFAQTLFEYIDARNISDAECYKRANVDKKTFSKIRCNKNYRPSKLTVLSFAIALHLNIDETNRLLNTVGMSLSKSCAFDIIIEYFITTGNYKDIFDVNAVLYKFDQQILGL